MTLEQLSCRGRYDFYRSYHGRWTSFVLATPFLAWLAGSVSLGLLLSIALDGR